MKKKHKHILIFKGWELFFNAQQMLLQLLTYIILFIPLYHAYKTFQFINTSPL